MTVLQPHDRTMMVCIDVVVESERVAISRFPRNPDIRLAETRITEIAANCGEFPRGRVSGLVAPESPVVCRFRCTSVKQRLALFYSVTYVFTLFSCFEECAQCIIT